MDTTRREHLDAAARDNPNDPEPTATETGSVLPQIESPLVSDAIDSMVLNAVTIPANVRGLEAAGPWVRPITTNTSAEVVEKQIGPYAIRARIGSGRAGHVYLAASEGEHPRDVVIKLARHAANVDAVLQQFQREAPTHAALTKHPNIISVLEAGATEDGRLYITRDYVEGECIDEYCDKRCLDVPTRLRLFSQVCAAVQFAHQHGMIHANLKPSNILVTTDGLPKVLDLGIARIPQTDAGTENTATSSKTTLTETDESLTTLEYASPEQIKGEVVTTASDIYSLGVILYRLVCGRWPYWVTSQSKADVLQAICEHLPEKPSTAITSRPVNQPGPGLNSNNRLSPGFEEVAALRSVSSRRLRKILAGDLDSIVLMALQKEPDRRYPSVKHLAEDVNAYLNQLPVQSRRDLPVYRTKKFIARHMTGVALGFFSLLLVVTGLIALTRELLIARYERDRAEKSLYQARETVDQISRRISNERLLDQPAMRRLRTTLLMDAQRYYKDLLSQRITDPHHQAEWAMAQAQFARISALSEAQTKAITHYQQAVALWEKLVTKEPDKLAYQANLAETLNNLGAILLAREDGLNEASVSFRRAQKFLERLVQREPQSESHHLQLGLGLRYIGEIQERQGKLDEAIDSINRALEIDLRLVSKDQDSIEPRLALATAYATLGRLLAQKPPELLNAIANYQQAVQLREAIIRQDPQLVDQSYQLAFELSKLGGLQQELGQSEAAIQCLRRALEVFEPISKSYPNIAVYQQGLGTAYNMISDLQRNQGDKDEGLALAHKARAIFERLIAENPENPAYRRDLAHSYNILGRLQAQAADPTIALRSFQRAIDLLESFHELNANDSYHLACNIALCIPLITRKNAFQGIAPQPSKGDRLRCQLYGDRAIESLRRSFKEGFLNSQILQDDTDLDALRPRADFQALLKEVEATMATIDK